MAVDLQPGADVPAATLVIEPSRPRAAPRRATWVYVVLAIGLLATLTPFIWMLLGLQARRRAAAGAADLVAGGPVAGQLPASCSTGLTSRALLRQQRPGGGRRDRRQLAVLPGIVDGALAKLDFAGSACCLGLSWAC